MSEEKDSSNEISMGHIGSVLKKFKTMIISTTLIAVSFSYVYTLIAKPVYVAELLMVPAQDQGNTVVGLSGPLAQIAGITAQGGSNTPTALAILKSRNFLEKYIRDENLLPIIFSDQWEENKGVWKNDKPNFSSATGKLKDAIHVIKKDPLLTVIVEWHDPVVAAKFANQIVSRVNEYIKLESTEESEKSIFFLEQELEKTGIVNIQAVLYSLIEEQTKKIMMANVREEFAFKVIDPAIVPNSPSKPNRRVALFLGLILGSTTGLLLAFIRNIFSRD